MFSYLSLVEVEFGLLTIMQVFKKYKSSVSILHNLAPFVFGQGCQVSIA